LYIWKILPIQRKLIEENDMRAKYRRLFGPTILMIAVASTAWALVSARTKTAATSRPERKETVKLAEDEKSSEPSIAEAIASTSSAFPPVQADPQNQKIEAEIITIRPTGIEPTTITRPKGPFILRVEDRSGLKEVEVQLSVDRGGRVFQVKASRERADWSRLVDPPPGRYVLTEVNHPEWTCTITITAE
jgi:hypothetical protein